MSTRVAIALTALTLLVVALTGLLSLVWTSHDRQAQALDIFKNCPMPSKGSVLVIEADWEGQTSADEGLRCQLLRKAPRKTSPRQGMY